jgi:hypothetical protein
MSFSKGWAGAAIAAMVVSGAAMRAEAAVNAVDIGINPTYEQTGSSTVTATGGFFAARAFLDSASDFDGGTLSWPGAASPQALTPQPGPILAYSVNNPSLSDLNAQFPMGTYTFDATNSVTSASQTDFIDYTVAADPLSIPQLTAAAYDGLQGLKAGSGFTFDFNSFDQNPDANLAYVFLSVSDSSGNVVFNQGFLDPSTTSVFMPGGTLSAGQQYTFDLVFDSRITGDDGTVGSTTFFDTHTDGVFTTAVPEPATWAMFILGFAGLGQALRRRSAKTRAATA